MKARLLGRKEQLPEAKSSMVAVIRRPQGQCHPGFFCPTLTFPHASYVLLPAKYNLHYGDTRLSCALADGSLRLGEHRRTRV